MSEIPTLLCVEPAAARRRAAAIAARKQSGLDLDSIKRELDQIRRYSRDNAASLMEEYHKKLSQFAGIEWTVAADAAQAASYVKQVAGRSFEPRAFMFTSATSGSSTLSRTSWRITGHCRDSTRRDWWNPSTLPGGLIG
jgi:hypothetical protein